MSALWVLLLVAAAAAVEFPSVLHTEPMREVRLKSASNEEYVFYHVGEDGALSYGTKPVASLGDTDVLFNVHLYDVPEMGETKLALPLNFRDTVCLRMTADRRLALEEENEIPEPEGLRQADSRFFYVKRAQHEGQDAYVFEAMNGEAADYGYLMAVSGSELTLLKHAGGGEYPTESIFYVDNTVYQVMAPLVRERVMKALGDRF